MKRLVIMSLILAMSCGADDARTAYTERVSPRPEYGIGPSNICLPIGRILLIRRNRQIYALRVIEALTDRDRSAFAATLEVSNLMAGNWKTRIERVEERQLRGFGHPFMFQTGNVRVDFVNFALRFNGPACVSMYRYNTEEADQGIAFAPTAWKSLSDVQMSASRLTWYRVDVSRSTQSPLSSLPGY
jgi:hypothetical protein